MLIQPITKDGQLIQIETLYMYLSVFVETFIDPEGLKQLICDNRNPNSVLFLLKLMGVWKVLISDSVSLACVDPESFVRRGPTLTTFFFI